MSDAAAPGESPDDAGTAPVDDVPAVPVDDVPTGEPDQALVDEAATEADAEPVDPAPDLRAPDDPAATGGDVPTGEPDAALVGEAVEAAAVDPVAADPVAGGVDPAPLAAELAGARNDIAGVRASVDSLLPELAAAAREETVGAGLAGLQKGVDELVRLTRRADEHVNELHGENQRLRAGELASATLPMFRDLVRLHDEVARLAEASHPEARDDLQLVGSRLLDTLARWGLTPFAPEPGERLDTTRHQGVGRVPSSEGEPGTIATVRKPGFAHDDGRTFRAAEVEVFAPPPPPPAGNDEE